MNLTDGKAIWQTTITPVGYGGGGSATINANLAYFGTWGRIFYALNVENGEVAWKYNTGGEVGEIRRGSSRG